MLKNKYFSLRAISSSFEYNRPAKEYEYLDIRSLFRNFRKIKHNDRSIASAIENG